jgi:hypothetical protein
MTAVKTAPSTVAFPRNLYTLRDEVAEIGGALP